MNTDMKKQTALQWLYAKLDQMPTRDEVCDLVYQLEEQAKAMEKEQMEQAWRNGFSSNEGMASYYYNVKYRRTPEKYYNETYGGDK